MGSGGPFNMERRLIIKPDDNEEENVVKFQPRIITGGKQPPSDYWLLNLPVGSVFLTKGKAQAAGFALGEFHVVYKSDKAVHLMSNVEGPETHLWVDPMSFSNQFRLFEILHEPTEEEE
jgi:hypothetical protein